MAGHERDVQRRHGDAPATTGLGLKPEHRAEVRFGKREIARAEGGEAGEAVGERPADLIADLAMPGPTRGTGRLRLGAVPRSERGPCQRRLRPRVAPRLVSHGTEGATL